MKPTDDAELAALQREEERLRALLAHAAGASLLLGEHLAVEYASPASERVLGSSPEELVALPSIDVLVDPDDQPRLRAAFEHALAHPGARVAVAFRTSQLLGRPRQIDATITNLLHDPSVEGLLLNLTDVTERRDFERAMAHQAMQDPLTGLPGRALLLDRVAQALSQRRDDIDTIVVLLLDLDRFKVVNDSLGHHEGDRLLVEIARRLVRVLRPDDTVARIGGDEFVVVCRDVGGSGVEDLAHRILGEIERPIDLAGGSVTITTSMGVVVARKDTSTTDAILRDADAAMYVAKERGRNRFAIFDESVHERALGRLDTEKALRRAIDHDELVLHYQPIFEIPTRRLVGIEALLRWRHPTRGLIDAAAFVPAAEESGLIGTIGTLALEEACMETARWNALHDQGLVRTWVNLAAAQLTDPELLGTVRRVLGQTGLDPTRLGFEITETGIIREPDAALAALTSLRDLGIAFALDDFGTGYSSLAYLRRFPVDVVKIDQSFVNDLNLEPRAPAIVDAIISMSHALDVTVTAEGVERHDQLEVLSSLECDAAQGFLLATPVPGHELGPVLVA